MMPKQNPKQHGIALISVLIIVALISTFVSLIWARQHQNFKYTKYTQTQTQMLQYLYSAESVAIDLLKKDENKDVDYIEYRYEYQRKNTEHWTKKNLTLPVLGGHISLEIKDLQKNISINNIVDTSNLSTPRLNSNILPIVNCLNTNLEQEQMAVFILNYISDLGTQHRFKQVNELQEILKNSGFKDKDYYNIKPNLNALPKGAKININTADSAVLTCLVYGVDLRILRDLMPFYSYDSAINGLASASLLRKQKIKEFLPNTLIDVKSQYFRLTTRISTNKIKLTGKTIFKRINNKNKSEITIISRSYY